MRLLFNEYFIFWLVFKNLVYRLKISKYKNFNILFFDEKFVFSYWKVRLKEIFRYIFLKSMYYKYYIVNNNVLKYIYCVYILIGKFVLFYIIDFKIF